MDHAWIVFVAQGFEQNLLGIECDAEVLAGFCLDGNGCDAAETGADGEGDFADDLLCGDDQKLVNS